MIKKNIWDMNEKELKSIPEYPWEKLPVVVQSIYFKANKRKHESGYSCMTSYALIEDKYYKIGECHDIIDIEEPIRIDCNPKNHLFHIWSWQGNLKIKYALSTLCFEVVKKEANND